MHEIVNDWPGFVREYCLNVEPGFNRETAIRALVTLCELWPDGVVQQAWGVRSIMNVEFLVRLGSTLADTRAAPGFDRVLTRARNNERSAVSELHFAARLARLGYAPRFEPEIAGKRPDIAVATDDGEVCFEVITPEKADLDKAAAKVMERAVEVIRAPAGHRLEVRMLTFPTDDVIEQLRAEILASVVDEWREIPDIARWKVERADATGSHFSWPGNDTRAVRLVRDEYHHFTGDVPYILVVDANAPLLTLPGLIQAFARTFQPNQYRRLSAGLVYTNYAVPPHFSTQWTAKVATNPHAARSVPPTLLESLMRIDEPI